jgi:rhodanese-related sulfurtransferase
MPFQDISPQQLAAMKDAPSTIRANAPQLIDVREPWEHQIAHIEGAQLLPLGQIYEWAATLDKSADYVIVCHHGGRSAMACQVLASMGFNKLANLAGGIESWAICVDPNVPRY